MAKSCGRVWGNVGECVGGVSEAEYCPRHWKRPGQERRGKCFGGKPSCLRSTTSPRRLFNPLLLEVIPTSPMSSQQKKKRTEDPPLPPDAGQRPIQLQRRRVWRACESCRCVASAPTVPISSFSYRRKKIKCDGNEPTCSQCAATGAQCTWLQTKDRAALSRK